MNTSRVAVAMAVGLLLSGSCTWLLSRKMSSGPAKGPELKFVAASRPLEAGETLKADNVALVSWPANVPVEGGFNKPEAVLGRVVLFPLGKGIPISEKYLSSPGTGNGLAWKIPAGMRAIALRSDEIVGVAGFLMPGSHVDVLATLRTDTSPEPTTFTVLEDAQVLAAGHETKPDPEGKPATVTVVTLLLSPTDAERAVLASLQGSIHFVLRSGTDTAHTEAAPVELTELLGKPVERRSEPAVRSVAAPPPPHAPQTSADIVVETMAGEKLTSDTFKPGAK